MNSPWSGRSSTVKVTSRIAVRLPNRLVTPGTRRCTGIPLSFLDRAMREKAALKPEQQAVDSVGEEADDQENQDDVL